MEEANVRVEKSLVPDTHCSVPLEDSGKMTSEELDRATVWVLCILWLRQDLAERAAKNLGVSLPLFGNLSIPVLRDALEPLTWLMHEDFGEEMIRCAKQVMVQFFLHGGFDDQSLSRLSTYRDTVSATARMLVKIVHYTCHSVKDCNLLAVPLMDVNSSRTHTPGTVRSLVHFLREKFQEDCAIGDCPILCTALPVLRCLASLNVANRRMILANEDFFEDMRLYICCSNFGEKYLASKFIYNANGSWVYFTSCVNDESSFDSIVRVRESVKRLFKHILTMNLFTEEIYRFTFSILCTNEDNQKLLLLEFPDTVAQLVKLVVNSGDDDLLFHVVGILVSLSLNNSDVQHQVGGTPGVIPKLVAVLSSENPPALQGSATGLLNILSSRQENCKALLEVPDTVARLVKLLVNSGDDNLLFHVVGILVSLSLNNSDVQHQVGGTPGVIPKLVAVLSSENRPALQGSASLLLNLLSRHHENCKAFLEVPDTVARLVKLLVNSGDDDLLFRVTGILLKLSLNNSDVQHQVGGTPGAIPKLVAVLSSENPPALQSSATGLLNILSSRQENCKALLEVPDTVARLVKLLVNSGDDNLLFHVVGILVSLSLNNSDVQHQVGGTPGVIPKLVAVLSSENPPALQSSATGLLNILSSRQENCKALLEVPDTVARLVKLLVNSGDDDLLFHVVGILLRLSLNNSDVQHQVGGTPGAIPKLVAVLSSENPPALQSSATGLLNILSSRQENCKALLEVPDTVARLVKLLVNSGDDDLLFHVVGILLSLSLNNSDVQHQVGGTPGAIPKLVAVLSSENRPALQGGASLFLNLLSRHHENCKAFLEVPDTVARLVKLLVNSGDDDLLFHVVGILLSLSLNNSDVQHQVGGTPGLIPKLLTVLSSENLPALQGSASLLLGILSDHQENRKALLEVPDTIAHLVKLLVDSGDDDLLFHVVGILLSLSLNNSNVRHQVGGTPGMIPKLVAVLSSENPPALQGIASVLLNLLSRHHENCKAFLEVPDTVARLVKLLVNNGDDDLLSHVARILFNLSWNNPDVQHRVGGTPGAISKLVAALSSENSPDLQSSATRLLSILSSRQENCKTLLEVPDTVARLVKLLVNSGDDDLLYHVAGILFNLSWNNPDVQHRVGGTPGVIPKLVAVLSSESPLVLQRTVSRLLNRLSRRQENRKALLEIPDTVAHLVKLLVNSGDGYLLYHVSQILITLSRSESNVQHHIGGISGAIQKILTILNWTSFPELQSSACGLLFALCNCEDNRELLSGTPDAVEELVGLSVSSYTVEHLDQLLEILCHLSKGNPSNQSRIGGTPGAISSLLTILLCVDSSSVRLEVSRLIFRLSSFQANRKLFLELPEGLQELVKLFMSSERVELLGNLAGVLNNLLEENPALENQIGEIMLSNPRRRTFRNLYGASRHQKLSLGLRQAMHYEHILFCSRFGYSTKKSLSFPGVSDRCAAVG